MGWIVGSFPGPPRPVTDSFRGIDGGLGLSASAAAGWVVVFMEQRHSIASDVHRVLYDAVLAWPTDIPTAANDERCPSQPLWQSRAVRWLWWRAFYVYLSQSAVSSKYSVFFASATTAVREERPNGQRTAAQRVALPVAMAL